MWSCAEILVQPKGITHLLWGNRAQHRGVANTRLGKKSTENVCEAGLSIPSLVPASCKQPRSEGIWGGFIPTVKVESGAKGPFGDVKLSPDVRFWVRREPQEH